MQTNETVILRHAQDAAYLWHRRRAILQTNRMSYAARARFDSRLEGHLDGLRLGGDAAYACALEQLEQFREDGEIFAATVCALSGDTERRLERVLSIARSSDDVVMRSALVSAFAWHPVDESRRLIDWAEGDDDWLAYVGLAALAVHRIVSYRIVVKGLRSQDWTRRARAARAASEMGFPAARAILRDLLTDGNPQVQAEAALALGRLSERTTTVTSALVGIAQRLDYAAERAPAALARLAPGDAHDLFSTWKKQSATMRLALVTAETLGDPAYIPDIIAAMSDPNVARFAGATFQTIVGADLEAEHLDTKSPAGFESVTDDPDDARVELGRDDELPWPSPLLVLRYWQHRQDAFHPGVRYLDGRAVGAHAARLTAEDADELRSIVQRGRSRSRQMAALSLAREVPTLPSVESRAPVTQNHPLPAFERWASFSGVRNRARKVRG